MTPSPTLPPPIALPAPARHEAHAVGGGPVRSTRGDVLAIGRDAHRRRAGCGRSRRPRRRRRGRAGRCGRLLESAGEAACGKANYLLRVCRTPRGPNSSTSTSIAGSAMNGTSGTASRCPTGATSTPRRRSSSPGPPRRSPSGSASLALVLFLLDPRLAGLHPLLAAPALDRSRSSSAVVLWALVGRALPLL